jgi:hypothetical protein
MRIAFARRTVNAIASPPTRASRDPHPALLNLPGAPIMTNVFAVVGEHRDDPDHLLVLGDDGSYYDYTVTTGQTEPVEPSAAWRADAPLAALDEALDIGVNAVLRSSDPEAA